MTVFDQLFFSVFNYYKRNKNAHANTIALWYISVLQIALIFLLGIFFSEFFKQMNVTMFSSKKAWILFGLVSVGIHFKNWIQYSGRKRKIRNANRSNSKAFDRSIYVLWLFPIALIGLSFILLKVL